MSETLKSQIDRLANFILSEIPEEPSQNEGAIDTAIRIMRDQQKVTRPSEALNLFIGWLTTRKEVSGPFSSGHVVDNIPDLISEYIKIQKWKSPREKLGPGSWGEIT